MIMHIFPAEKFTEDFIKRINNLFDENDHIFFVYGGNPIFRKESVNSFKNVICVKRCINGHRLFREYLTKCERVILHSLFLSRYDLIYIYYMTKMYKKDCAWYVWGGDLYNTYWRNHQNRISVTSFVEETFRKRIIKNLKAVSAACDYQALKKMYQINAVNCPARYSYKLISFEESKTEKDISNIMVGHSATLTCRHIETFQLLRPYAGKVKVFCPLSYPSDEDYIETVISEGKRLFGDYFVPLRDFMNYDQYIEFLNNIDIGLFNNDRQQGFGNITNLIYLGKKVYLSDDNTINNIYCYPNYYVFNINEINDANFLMPLSDSQKVANKKAIEKEFSDNTFKKQWETFFYAK